MSVEIPRFWEQSVPELLAKLGSRASGLSSDEAHRRLKTYGKNTVHRAKRIPSLILLLSQFKSPIILILLAVSLVSLFLGDPANSLIIIVIVLISSLLGFWQEKGASDIVQRLLSIVHVKANMLRDGREVQVPIEDSVPGDITILSAGDSIPGDCLIIESEDLSVDESVLTGESVPVDKRAGTVEGSAPFSRRSNSLFMGTHVVNGTARALVVNTDRRTEFGRIASRLGRRKPPTDFELGIKRFGWFIMALSMVMVAAIFLINLAFRKPLIESLLFSLSLAVGLTPQLLPAIITVNLAKGAKRMAGLKVVVKRLDSIENLGSMNILCSDKTGTLTEGVMKARSFLDPSGRHCETVFFHAYLTAMLKKGFRNPIDKAIREYRHADITGYSKRGEVQYDFERKRMSMLVEKNGEAFIVAKGAFSSIIGICDRAEKEPGQRLPLADNRTTIERTFDSLGEQGFRVLGVAYRPAAQDAKLTKEEEKGMIFLGFVVLADPPKAGIREVIRRLESTGVRLKILTGDNKEVAHYICHAAFGLEGDVKTGEEISDLPEKEFARALEETEIFAEIDPLLKERIIRAFRDAGNVVGFLGDGINDTPALHACDASITVNSAVDIAKETSDIVLLEKDLGVLTDGIYEGRKTFANTLKYIFMATSANFGGTFSYLGTAFFLPFLPMLPKQVLVNNLMTDLPALTLPSDSVDRELIDKPQRWNIGFIRRFMITFGLLSSSFDYLTFGTLIFFFRAQEAFFHTGWFVESVVTSVLIVFVIRTRKPFFRSMPGKLLFWTSAADALAICVLFPFSGLGRILEFVPLPASYFAALALIVALFFLSAELTKEFFYRRLLRNTSKGPPGPAIREKQPALSAK